MATGTVNITEETHTSVKKIKFEWTSTAGGEASDTTSQVYDGEVMGLVAVPDAVDTPTDQYDITITDKDDVDVVAGNGQNMGTTTEYVTPVFGVVANSKLTLNIANAGSSKKGIVYLYVR